MKINKLVLLLALFAAMPALAVKYVAVVETDIDAASGASAALNPAEVRLITAELRRQASENLPSDKYSVMTSETVMSMGGAVLEECSEENCVISLGSKIGADYIVRGTISKFQTKFMMTVEMYETDNGTLVITSEPIRSENIEGLLDKTSAATSNMYRKFLERQGVVGAKKATPSTQSTLSTGYSSENEYKDFTAGQRWATWGLNILPGGLGSFLVMRDNVGGGIILGGNALYVLAAVLDIENGDGDTEEYAIVGLTGFFGAGIFNIFRSAFYHKPKPKTTSTTTASADFKPYDGLKLAIVPTATGDYKVFARYDYTF